MKIDSKEIASYGHVMGLVIQEVVKALIFVNGKILSRLDAGSYEFKSFPNVKTDADIETLCEFALFGDPSASTGKIKIESSISPVNSEYSKIRGLNAGNISIFLPDVRAAVRLSLTVVDKKISETINSYVYKSYVNMKGIVPKTYSML